jgi:hypothetical protein
MTQTIVIVNTNDLDDDIQSKDILSLINLNIEYQEIEEYHNDHQKSIHDISSSESLEYEDMKGHTSNEETPYASVKFYFLSTRFYCIFYFYRLMENNHMNKFKLMYRMLKIYMVNDILHILIPRLSLNLLNNLKMKMLLREVL